MTRNLALAVATLTGESDFTEATIEDLLNYLPMRWEASSNLNPRLVNNGRRGNWYRIV